MKKDTLETKINILAIILARGGSKGIPKKNIQKLMGRPLLAYTVDAAKQAKQIDHIVLSTDDIEIANIAKSEGVEIIMRPSEFATDTAPMHQALCHAVQEVEKKEGKIQVVVSLFANIPLRKEGVIDEAITKLIETSADSIKTYYLCNKPPQWAVKIENDSPELLHKEYAYAYRRQLLPPTYYPDGSVIVVKRDVLMRSIQSSDPYAFLGTNKIALVSNYEDTVDVDTPIDLLWAEFLMKKKKFMV